MRVLNSVTDPRMGGPQRRSLQVAGSLRKRDIETEFLIPEGDDAFDEVAAEEGFTTHRLPLPRPRSPPNLRANSRFVLSFRRTVTRIGSLIDTRDYDVVHANMPVNFQTALAAVRSDTPLAWHFNDTLTPTPIKQIAAYAGGRWADEIVVAADAVHDYYFDEATPSRTIYAPVDLDTFDPDRIDIDETALRSNLGIKPDLTIVGTVGNLNPIKGHEYLLRAIATLDEREYEVAVPIVGAELATRRQYLERLRSLRDSLGLSETVRFLGFRSDIPQLLSLFDVFVLPSVAEACPIVVLEAMAMQCPVVATAVGGVPEQLPDADHGWVVPPEDDDALADAIGEALNEPNERRRRAANAYERVVSEFSLTACVDRHEDLYSSLVSEA
ncbi:glycosyltransferase family 4 protein [Natronomonas halophila]|nr:glycosyltransferase family 4 protein [Natronomonas halophila]